MIFTSALEHDAVPHSAVKVLGATHQDVLGLLEVGQDARRPAEGRLPDLNQGRAQLHVLLREPRLAPALVLLDEFEKRRQAAHDGPGVLGAVWDARDGLGHQPSVHEVEQSRADEDGQDGKSIHDGCRHCNGQGHSGVCDIVTHCCCCRCFPSLINVLQQKERQS